ncbi:amino acid ABC transporter ATP-binding protein [Gluconobacter cerinus]|uniref:amino acid ABC transporter ATP-binding protein n=1 Tax=Gluconobacter cerinus TaxID=38307 RepID=UPI001B8B209A|nr:amino acid ABC transporter ATP-binding protein [Gluconobacter cerinus]MBS1019237.1 amino acid ABC transporter ATP-binding protein [Gluconobacter cerinus]MBS1067804.1 amino acid ABC transporter ATP-binding protein [Gluconobacter cerinus]
MTPPFYSDPGLLSDPVLNVRQLLKSFRGAPVLSGVDLAVSSGEIACLIGPSGAGKSTLLRCLNFLERPDGGEITFFGERLCSEDGNVFHIAPERTLQSARARMPMVFQHFNLFSHRTIIENVMEGQIVVLRRQKEEARERARACLTRVGLLGHADSYPDQLSGGQKQRVAIARALAMSPALILFDEPTSALDPALVQEVQSVMRDLSAEGMTMLIVTHDMRLVRSIATTVHFCADGHIAESGSPATLFEEARSSRTHAFMTAAMT